MYEIFFFFKWTHIFCHWSFFFFATAAMNRSADRSTVGRRRRRFGRIIPTWSNPEGCTHICPRVQWLDKAAIVARSPHTKQVLVLSFSLSLFLSLFLSFFLSSFGWKKKKSFNNETRREEMKDRRGIVSRGRLYAYLFWAFFFRRAFFSNSLHFVVVCCCRRWMLISPSCPPPVLLLPFGICQLRRPLPTQSNSSVFAVWSTAVAAVVESAPLRRPSAISFFFCGVLFSAPLLSEQRRKDKKTEGEGGTERGTFWLGWKRSHFHCARTGRVGVEAQRRLDWLCEGSSRTAFFLFGYAVVLEVFSVRNRMNSFFFNYFWFSSDRKLCFSSEHKMDQMIIL